MWHWSTGPSNTQLRAMLADATAKEQARLAAKEAIAALGKGSRCPPVAWATRITKPRPVENPKEKQGRKKLPLQLCPSAALRDMAAALNHGANIKGYGEWNWREAGVNLMTYIGALRRHIDAIHAGEDVDPESGLPHIAHVLAGAAIVSDAAEHGMLNDDRPHLSRPPKEPAETADLAKRKTGVDGDDNLRI